MNAKTIFLGLSVGATMTVDAFLNLTTIGIVMVVFLHLVYQFLEV